MPQVKKKCQCEGCKGRRAARKRWEAKNKERRLQYARDLHARRKKAPTDTELDQRALSSLQAGGLR